MFEPTHETEYLDKPILRCARNIFGTKTWGLSQPPSQICVWGAIAFPAPPAPETVNFAWTTVTK